jgi:predicted O-linked N-acetylglucosamine transferase (SPINDLY family)
VPDQLTKSRADFGLTDRDVVYLCCQAPFKYLPQHDYLLPAIAAAVPHSKFVFVRGDSIKQRLSSAFAAQNLAIDDFCLFLPSQPRNDYLSLNLISDVYLDTIGFNGGNMTFDALACGLPVVTLPGELMRGRFSAAMLNRLGITETIAQNESHYIELAVNLGRDRDQRSQIQQKIQQMSHLLFGDQSTVTALEDFYQQLTHQPH